jgi:hypothetical protein
MSSITFEVWGHTCLLLLFSFPLLSFPLLSFPFLSAFFLFHKAIEMKAYLDGPLLEHLIGEGCLVEDDLSVHHVVDRLALHVGVEDLAPGHAGIERVPYLVPRHRHGDWTCENEN